MTKLRMLTALSATSLLSFSAPAWAHHAANAAYVPDKFVTMQAVLSKFELINPHSQFEFLAPGPDGKQATWHIESSAPSAMRRANLTQRGTFNPGDTYTIIINPSRDGSPAGFLREIDFPSGRKVNMAAGTLDKGE